MSATVKRKLFGMLALGAALAFAGGCVGAPGESDDDDEDIGAAVSGLDAIDSDGAPDTADDAEPTATHGAPSAGDSAPSGMHPMIPVSGPDPLPWVPPGEDPEMDVGAPPMTRGGMGGPSTGNGGK